jgi:hypothetical protein
MGDALFFGWYSLLRFTSYIQRGQAQILYVFELFYENIKHSYTTYFQQENKEFFKIKSSEIMIRYFS